MFHPANSSPHILLSFCHSVILHSYSTFISRFLCRAIRLLYVMQIKKRRVCKPLPCFADNEDETVADAVDCRDYRAEGNELAEAGNMEGALQIWQMGLNAQPNNHILLELKAQALLSLDHYFLAIQSAEACIQLAPQWSVGYLTLAR